MKRTRLKRRGARAEREAEALEAFRAEVLARGACEECGATFGLTAHHMATRARAPGHRWLHDASRNGAALCWSPCHAAVHAGHDGGQWLKDSAWLEAGGKLL